MAKHFDKQFKLDAIQYYKEHAELGLKGCAKNLGVSQQSISRWKKELSETGDLVSHLVQKHKNNCSRCSQMLGRGGRRSGGYAN